MAPARPGAGWVCSGCGGAGYLVVGSTWSYWVDVVVMPCLCPSRPVVNPRLPDAAARPAHRIRRRTVIGRGLSHGQQHLAAIGAPLDMPMRVRGIGQRE